MRSNRGVEKNGPESERGSLKDLVGVGPTELEFGQESMSWAVFDATEPEYAVLGGPDSRYDIGKVSYFPETETEPSEVESSHVSTALCRTCSFRSRPLVDFIRIL